MNPLTQFKKMLILPLIIALSLGFVAPALATPPSGVTTVAIADGTFDDIDVHIKTGAWKTTIDTKGASDLHVLQNTVIPGGTLGWHSHPVPSLVIVVSGTASFYTAEDCTTPHVFQAPSQFIDNGSDVHLLRNEGNVNLVVVVVRLVPEGAAPRIDEPNPNPGVCPQ